MTEADLETVRAWLARPHVARWWLRDTTADEQLSVYRSRVAGEDTRTTMLMVHEHDVPIGWCQWYRWADYPAARAAVHAQPGEAGIDYAIGEPDRIGRGLGTELVGLLVAESRAHRLGVGVLADPYASNVASCRVLEKNGFELVQTEVLPRGRA